MDNKNLQNLNQYSIFEYDFDYFHEINNLETDNIDLLDIDLNEEQYLAIHNDVHSSIIIQNMNIISSTKEKIKKDFDKIINRFLSDEHLRHSLDLNDPLLAEWNYLFTAYDSKYYFLNRLFMISTDRFPEWFALCKRFESSGFFGNILLSNFRVSSEVNHIDKDFNEWMTYSHLITPVSIQNMMHFLYESHPNNKKNLDSFICDILTKILNKLSDQNSDINEVINKALELAAMISLFDISLTTDNSKLFSTQVSKKLDSFFNIKNKKYIEKTTDLIFAYTSLFDNNIVKQICNTLTHKDKINFIESSLLSRVIKEDEVPFVKIKKRL